ncbi:MAG TPA: PQQ-binding-like beta-propeller repeat protein [Candidatus Elarobacter sp.]|nr:PQQ-binding-like beta-propeller repeat protein [Candidatus Elarobacter sp.]
MSDATLPAPPAPPSPTPPPPGFPYPPQPQPRPAVAIADGTAYVTRIDRVVAVDLASGRTRWTSEGGLSADSAPLAGAGRVLIEAIRLPPDYAPSTVALRSSDGARAYRIPNAWTSGIVDGVLYATRGSRSGSVYGAYDAATGARYWATTGAGGSNAFPPHVVAGLVLQPSADSGAITLRSLYAMDVRTGHVRWVQRSSEELGVSGDTMYVESTWPPDVIMKYVPMTVAHIRLRDGSKIDEYVYAPDPDRNANRPNEQFATSNGHHVVAGFVYLRVEGAWYRYRADLPPEHAQPTRFDGIDDVLAWFANGTLLVSAHGDLSLARDEGGTLVLRRFARARAVGTVFARDDGTQYVIAGGALLAIAPDAGSVRRIGADPCPGNVQSIGFSGELVAAVCEPGDGTARIVTYRDTAPPPATPPPAGDRPAVAPPPRFTAHLEPFAIPPPDTPQRQWWFPASAPAPDGGLAFLLESLHADIPDAIGLADPHGRLTLRPLGDPDHSVAPDALVVDRHGTVWYNDRLTATVSSLARNGAPRTMLIGEPTPLPTPPPPAPSGFPHRFRRIPNTTGIRLAIGPDGEAWFARSHPTREIGRVDGTRRFAIPDTIGDIGALRGTRDGFWYAARAAVGHVTLGGVFTPLPIALDRVHNAAPVLAPAPDGSLWVTEGGRIVHATRRGVLLRTQLPDATLTVQAATVGCDGVLYAVEDAARIARVEPSGRIDEVDLGDAPPIDRIVTAADCRLWYVAGSHAQVQQFGRLEVRAEAPAFTKPAPHRAT